MTLKEGYIHLFGTVAAVLDILEDVCQKQGCPQEILYSYSELEKAIETTEEYVDL